MAKLQNLKNSQIKNPKKMAKLKIAIEMFKLE